ncbi:MAG TPA: VIT domain-containing protein, partial [Caldimonas sp.]|nr:VIT domain-containing protein [Caldimonas sp.]
MLARLFGRFLLLATGCTAAALAVAQPTPAIVAPPWRAPVLLVEGAAQPVRLRTLGVEVTVAAGVAETRVRMEFFNPNSRTLEGKLQFPLGAGQVVTGFALDVDGELRDAVPVEKARAEQVFEDITRRRADPGLLQKTVGNNYELRIYPLPPGKTRTVVLKLVEPAGDRLMLPLAYAARVERLDLSLRYPGVTTRPAFVGASPQGLAFVADRQGGFTARVSVANATLARWPLVVRAARTSAPGATTQSFGDETYFAVDLPISQRVAPRRLPKHVQIVWDASASAANRNIDDELALLDAYFRKAQTLGVTLVRVADVAATPERFTVRDGDWSALRRALLATVYDGASNLGAVHHDGVSSEALWFTDGLANYGAPWHIAFPVPVYAVSSSVGSDEAALQALAEASGGRRIDLLSSTRAQAAAALLEQGTRLVDIEAVGARGIVVETHRPAAGRLQIAGVLTAGEAELTLRLRNADGTAWNRPLRIRAGENAAPLAAWQWARLTLASLEGEPRLHKARIRELGQRFGLATPETSLLVLERVEDYVQHGIEPPPALRPAYDRLAGAAKQQVAANDARRLADVVRRFDARVAWWNRDFPKDAPQAPLAVANAAPRAAVGTALASRRDVRIAESEANRQPSPSPSMSLAAAANSAAPAVEAGTRPAAQKRREAGNPGAGADADAATPASISIALKPALANAPWMRRLEAAEPASRLAVYLDERRANATSVAFFLDCADFFLAKGQREMGLRVLSNLAEMDLQNRQVLRLLGYRLQQAGETNLAVPIFERVLELAPYEPQSHRDLGLALAAAGRPQAAVDRLYEVVTGAWDARFADIDLIALAELNAIVARSERDGKPVNVAAIDPRLLKNMPLDVRVVLAWDADATDVDLHVIDPNGEEVFYGHNLSYQGGTISHDATGGYGPEEFSLRHAKPGKYRIEANFFGHRQQILTSSTGLMMWLSSGFATKD